jgi:hypothetical protein
MGRACRTNGVWIYIGFWLESQKESDHYEDLDVGRMIILKRISEK